MLIRWIADKVIIDTVSYCSEICVHAMVLRGSRSGVMHDWSRAYFGYIWLISAIHCPRLQERTTNHIVKISRLVAGAFMAMCVATRVYRETARNVVDLCVTSNDDNWTTSITPHRCLCSHFVRGLRIHLLWTEVHIGLKTHSVFAHIINQSFITLRGRALNSKLKYNKIKMESNSQYEKENRMLV